MKIKVCHRKGINIRVKVNETKNTMINKTDIVLREEKNMQTLSYIKTKRKYGNKYKITDEMRNIIVDSTEI